MPHTITCPTPECGRQLRVPDNLVGKKVKCPSCGETFVAQGDEAPPPPPDEELERQPQEEERPVRRRSPRDDDYEDEREERPRRRRRFARRDGEPHRGSLVLVFGILSVVFAPFSCCGVFGILAALVTLGLGIPAWVIGQGDLKKMRAGVMDPSGEGQTRAGMVCGIVGSCFASLIILLMLVFVVIYLVAVFAAAAQEAAR